MKKLPLFTMLILLGFSGVTLALTSLTGSTTDTCVAAVQKSFSSDTKLDSSNINVSCMQTTAGTKGYDVTLSGTVPKGQESYAYTDAMNATGVVSVKSNLNATTSK